MNPTHDALLRKYVSRAPHMRDIGMAVTALGADRGTMVLPDRPDWLGDPARGLLHPGPLIVLADSACGLAVGAAMTQPTPYATLDLRMDYLRPAGPGHDLHCEAHCYRMTRSVAFVRGEVWQRDRADPVAGVQATFMLSTPAGTHPSQHAAQRAAAEAPPPVWTAPTGDDPVLDQAEVPYVQYLGLRLARGGDQPLFRMPYDEKLIGNPRLPALHGGVVAGFAETAATLHLIRTLGGAKFPKCIDFSIDYLRAGRPEATYAACEVVRQGARVALVQVRCWQGRGPEQPIVVARGHFLLTEAEAAAPAGG